VIAWDKALTVETHKDTIVGMVGQNRESRLATTFVRLADTLVVGFDMVDLLQSLVETSADLLDRSAAGLVLSDGNAQLEPVASTSEEIARIELLAVRSGEGPSIACVASGSAVSIENLGEDMHWPAYSSYAQSLGFASVHTVPLRLRTTVIGALSVYGDHIGPLASADAAVAQSLADIATISILQERALRESGIAVEQLQHALNSRVIIEQAKGVVAYVRGVGMDDAFNLMRRYSRSNNVPLREVAARIVERSLTI